MSLDEAYAIRDDDGLAVGDELRRIGYAGELEPGAVEAHAYLELHIEQGPILDAEGGGIGAVTGVQGITWLEFTVEGEPNHAGTTPMKYRRDAGYAAARIISFARELTRMIEGQVANAGQIAFEPGNVNVVPARRCSPWTSATPMTFVSPRRSGACGSSPTEVARGGARRDLGPRSRPLPGRALRRAPRRRGRGCRGRTRETRPPDGLGRRARRSDHGLGRSLSDDLRAERQGALHNPQEYTAPDDLVAGANVLLAAAIAAVND